MKKIDNANSTPIPLRMPGSSSAAPEQPPPPQGASHGDNGALSSLPRRSSSSSKMRAARATLPQQATSCMPSPMGLVKKALSNKLFGPEANRRQISPYSALQLALRINAGIVSEVKIQGEAGALSGHYHAASPENSTGKVALFLSGSHAPAEAQSAEIAAKYQTNGVDVLAVNYRGYGASEGKPSEQGLYSDAHAMLKHLVEDRKIAPENIIVHGYSVSGPVAAELAVAVQNDGVKLGGVVLDRPMPSIVKGTIGNGVPMANLSGQVMKRALGSFSVIDNLKGLSKDTQIVMLTDRDGLGDQGEILRNRLAGQGFPVSGARTPFAHSDSASVIELGFDAIKSAFIASGKPDASGAQSGMSDATASRKNSSVDSLGAGVASSGKALDAGSLQQSSASSSAPKTGLDEFKEEFAWLAPEIRT